MHPADETSLDRKSGGAKRRDLLFYRKVRTKRMLEYATTPLETNAHIRL